MNCLEANEHSIVGKVNFSNYGGLHSDGRRLISGWFKRAWKARDAKAEDCFEPFIFVWFAVNGWAACVTEIDSDRKYLKVLMNDRAINEKFDELFRNNHTPFSIHVRDFAEYWPIFEVKDLRKKGILRAYEGKRIEIVHRYFEEGAEKFEPQCWQDHMNAEGSVPVDWPHTLYAIYRVRCNLFHGEKAAHSEMDQLIVSKAFRTLIHFFKEAHYIS